MTDINLLPWRAAQFERRTRGFMIASVIAAGLALAGVLAARYQAQGGLTQRQDAVDSLQQKQTLLEAALDERHRWQQQEVALAWQLRRFDRLRYARIGLVHRFDALARLLPENAWYTAISRQGESLEITGMALDEGSVAALMRGIEESSWFAGPVALQLQQPPGGGSDPAPPYRFQLSVRLVGAGEQP